MKFKHLYMLGALACIIDYLFFGHEIAALIGTYGSIMIYEFRELNERLDK